MKTDAREVHGCDHDGPPSTAPSERRTRWWLRIEFAFLLIFQYVVIVDAGATLLNLLKD